MQIKKNYRKEELQKREFYMNKSTDYFEIKIVNNGIDGKQYQIGINFINIMEQLVWLNIENWNKYSLFRYLFGKDLSDENVINRDLLNDPFDIEGHKYKMNTIKELFDTLKDKYNADNNLRWKNKKDVQKAIEYLESLVIMKKLCK